VWSFGPVAAYVCLVYALSLDPGTPKTATPGLDKVAHLVEYGVLGLLLSRAVGGRARGVMFASMLVLGVAVGIADEVIQSHVPGRQAGADDVIADAVGVTVGLLAGTRVWMHELVRGWV